MKKHFTINKVLLRYFISYTLILFVSLFGLYYIVQFQLRNQFNTTYTTQIENNTEHLSDIFNSQFLKLYQIDRSLHKNTVITTTRNKSDAFYDYTVQTELDKYLYTTLILQDLIYINKKTEKVYGFEYNYTYTDDTLYIRKNNEINYSIPLSELTSPINTFKRLESNGHSLLLFIPEQNSTTFFSIFIINTNELTSLLNTIMTPSITNITLTNTDGDTLFSLANDKLANVSLLPSDITSTVQDCDYAQLNITSYYSNKLVNKSINTIFRKTYITVLFLFIIGIICIIVLTHFSYAPLKFFAHFLYENNIDSTANEHSYLDLKYASQVFKSIKTENDELLRKVKNYRLNMQKSLLSAIIPSSASPHIDSNSIDILFDTQSKKTIFVIQFCIKSTVAPNVFSDALYSAFHNSVTIISLNNTLENHTYLFCVPDDFSMSDDILDTLLEPLMATYECTYIRSRLSDNPIELSRLYEEVLSTSMINPTETLSMYQILDQLHAMLEQSEYAAAKTSLTSLFERLTSEDFPNFFVQSVLLDMLTIMVSLFSKMNVPFSSYSDDYYETLYLCRSNKFDEVSGELATSFSTLMAIFEKHKSHPTLTKEAFSDYISKEFMNSNFSISQVGDYFQVSGTYISYWFKKNFDLKLSEYLWSLRFNYAVELMQDSTLSMEEISKKVGYNNYSSFRRKFKNTCGVSPTEYRNQNAL